MTEKEKPHIVLIAGDEEYRSEEALPQLAKILSTHHNFNCTVLFSQNPALPGVADPNYSSHIPGLKALESADLMILSTRFRSLPDDQMKFIDQYLMAGKPVIGLRTATHAFQFKEDAATSYRHYSNNFGEGKWKGGFGQLVLGENWVSHHGKHGHESTRGIFPKKIQQYPILNGIQSGEIWGPTDVYEAHPNDDCEILLYGEVVLREGDFNESDPLLGMRPTDRHAVTSKNSPMMPVAWTKDFQLPDGKTGKCFTTTMGSSTDLLSEGLRRLLINAAYWGMDMDIPSKAMADLVGVYEPTKFAFHKDSHWAEKNIIISEIK